MLVEIGIWVVVASVLADVERDEEVGEYAGDIETDERDHGVVAMLGGEEAAGAAPGGWRGGWRWYCRWVGGGGRRGGGGSCAWEDWAWKMKWSILHLA